MNTTTAILGDCMEVMKDYPDKYFDLAVVDPPYGININMNMGLRKGKRKRHNKKNWDSCTPDAEYFDELIRVSENQIVWGGQYMCDKLPVCGGWIFWDKLTPAELSFSDGELAWTSFDCALKKVTIRNTGGGVTKMHPTQKPVKLYDWIFHNYAQPGFKILDTHLGSGSSRIAADRAGLEFIGIEIDAEYFEKQEQRFREYKSQLTMF